MAEQLEIGKLIYDLEEEALVAMKEVAEKRDMDESSAAGELRLHVRPAAIAADLYSRVQLLLARHPRDRLPALEGDQTLWRIGFKTKLSTNEQGQEHGEGRRPALEEDRRRAPNTPWASGAGESLYAMGWNGGRRGIDRKKS